jgi:hypothetical protein
MTNSKLNDIQLILLSTAAQREDGSLLPPPTSLGGQSERIAKAIVPLIKRKLAEEIPVTDAARSWRSDKDQLIGLVITQAGRAIIGTQDAGEGVLPTGPSLIDVAHDARGRAGGRSKIAKLLVLLGSEAGATLEEMIAATGWLPHTTRAALTGLRKKGHVLTKAKRGDATCWSIEGHLPESANANEKIVPGDAA